MFYEDIALLYAFNVFVHFLVLAIIVLSSELFGYIKDVLTYGKAHECLKNNISLISQCDLYETFAG